MVIRFAAYLALLPALMAPPALAQFRTPPIPAESYRGVMRHLNGMTVAIDEKPAQLAPGGQIRDQQNLIIVPTAIPQGGAWADYTLDVNGEVFRAWLLTPDELARPKPAPGGG